MGRVIEGPDYNSDISSQERTLGRILKEDGRCFDEK